MLPIMSLCSTHSRPNPAVWSRPRRRRPFARDKAHLGIRDLDVQRHVRRPSQTPDPDALLGAHFAIPLLQPLLQPSQGAFDSRQPQIVPQPPGQQAHRAVEPVAEAERIKRLDELPVDLRDDAAELLLGEQRVEDLGIQVRERRGEIPLDHPVAADADDPRRRVFLRRNRHVGVHVRETRVGRPPGEFLRHFAVVGPRAGGMRADSRGTQRGHRLCVPRGVVDTVIGSSPGISGRHLCRVCLR